MRNLENRSGLRKNDKIKLTLRNMASEAICWYEEERGGIIIVGGSEKDVLALSRKMEKDCQGILIHKIVNGYKSKLGEYIINLEEIEFVY